MLTNECSFVFSFSFFWPFTLTCECCLCLLEAEITKTGKTKFGTLKTVVWTLVTWSWPIQIFALLTPLSLTKGFYRAFFHQYFADPFSVYYRATLANTWLRDMASTETVKLWHSLETTLLLSLALHQGREMYW